MGIKDPNLYCLTPTQGKQFYNINCAKIRMPLERSLKGNSEINIKFPKTNQLMQRNYCLKTTLFICLKTCFIPIQDYFYFTTHTKRHPMLMKQKNYCCLTGTSMII